VRAAGLLERGISMASVCQESTISDCPMDSGRKKGQ
jgi:hypothetical protein